MVHFHKYHGTGNDFILVDGRNISLNDNFNETLVKQMCCRRFGVGADGFIVLRNPPSEDLDFEMIYYNSDGRISSLCGNGSRCIVKFARKLGVIERDCQFMAIDGIHKASIEGESISIQMQSLNQWEKRGNDVILDTGSPHFVNIVQNLQTIDVVKEGQKIRYSSEFSADGINVNFVQQLDNVLHVATYERGVEGETFSCGTGVVAAALAASIINENEINAYSIQTKGGELRVTFKRSEKGFENIYLVGPAEHVFEGNFFKPALCNGTLL